MLQAAKAGQKDAVRRLRESQQKILAGVAKVEGSSEELWKKRAAAVMSLKESIQQVYSDMAERVSLYRCAAVAPVVT